MCWQTLQTNTEAKSKATDAHIVLQLTDHGLHMQGLSVPQQLQAEQAALATHQLALTCNCRSPVGL